MQLSIMNAELWTLDAEFWILGYDSEISNLKCEFGCRRGSICFISLAMPASYFSSVCVDLARSSDEFTSPCLGLAA